MTASKLRKYEALVATARQAAAKEQDWERVVAPDPALPLLSAGWENERTDIHGIACTTHSTDALRAQTVILRCYCGHEDAASSEDAAFDLLVAHARTAALVAAA